MTLRIVMAALYVLAMIVVWWWIFDETRFD